MKIGIVNDLPGVAALLRRVVGVDPANQVVWVALNGAEGVELCAKETPDLMRKVQALAAQSNLTINNFTPGATVNRPGANEWARPPITAMLISQRAMPER